MNKQTIIDLLIISIVLAFTFFWGALVGHDATVKQNRGCIASAYQAAAHLGEDTLEANLKVCYEGV